jgi:hypothetical protein
MRVDARECEKTSENKNENEGKKELWVHPFIHPTKELQDSL